MPAKSSGLIARFHELPCGMHFVGINGPRPTSSTEAVSDDGFELFLGWLTAQGREDSEGPLLAWHSHVSHRTTASSGASEGRVRKRQHCGHIAAGVQKYGPERFYRLVTRIMYRSQKVYVLKVMTHKEYRRREVEAPVWLLYGTTRIQNSRRHYPKAEMKRKLSHGDQNTILVWQITHGTLISS